MTLRPEGCRAKAASTAALVQHKSELVTPDDPVAGNPQGDVTIVEFFDTRCPYCRRLEPTMASLLRTDRGIRLVYKDMPILGPASVTGSTAVVKGQFGDRTLAVVGGLWRTGRCQ